MDLLCLKNKNGARWAGGMDERRELGSERKTEPQRESGCRSVHKEKPQEDADPPPNGLHLYLELTICLKKWILFHHLLLLHRLYCLPIGEGKIKNQYMVNSIVCQVPDS